jgi:hypothetical protein
MTGEWEEVWHGSQLRASHRARSRSTIVALRPRCRAPRAMEQSYTREGQSVTQTAVIPSCHVFRTVRAEVVGLPDSGARIVGNRLREPRRVVRAVPGDDIGSQLCGSEFRRVRASGGQGRAAVFVVRCNPSGVVAQAVKSLRRLRGGPGSAKATSDAVAAAKQRVRSLASRRPFRLCNKHEKRSSRVTQERRAPVETLSCLLRSVHAHGHGPLSAACTIHALRLLRMM